MSDPNKLPRMRPVILMVEDEGLLTRMYSRKLEIDGFDVLEATNGEDGVKHAKDFLPDIIICDMMMPIMDGLAVLRELKADKETKNIPVIMLTNVSDERYTDEALELGAVSYLIKGNLTPADVVAEIKEKLEAMGKKKLVKD